VPTPPPYFFTTCIYIRAILGAVEIELAVRMYVSLQCACMYVCISTYEHTCARLHRVCIRPYAHVHAQYTMEWLRLVGSLKLQVSFAKEPYKRDYILQKRPIILSILLTVTPYEH